MIETWAARHGVSRLALAELATLFTGSGIGAIPGGAEAITQAALRVEAPRLGGALWRNNNGATLDESGRMVRYGLANDSKRISEVFKSSDLIGITPVEWYNRRFGVFTAVEVKEPGWRGVRDDREKAQQNFGLAVESMGGIFIFARSVEDYKRRLA